MLRAKRDILGRSYVGGMFTHRTATPGPGGRQRRLRRGQQLRLLPERPRRRLRRRARKSEGRDGNDLSYRGFFDYNADRYGLQAERLEVQPNFLPELGFLRRTDFRRNFGLLRFSPRPKNVPHLRKVTMQASLNYTTNTENRLDTREQVGQFQTEFTNSDVAGVIYTDTIDRLVRPFAIAPGIRIPAGAYGFHTTQLSYTGGQQRKLSGAVVYETGTFYSGTRQSLALNSARVELTPQFSVEPSFSVNWVDLLEGSFTATVVRARDHVHRHAAHVRQRHRPVQLHEHVRRQQRPLPLGVSARQRDLRGLHRRLQHRDPAGADPLRNRAIVVKVNRLFRP